MQIGVIGNGFVGKATQLLQGDNISMLVYDIDPEKSVPKNLNIQELNKCQLIFVCVPTPMNKDGSCYLGMVEDAINNCKKVIDSKKTHIVLRSTVPPGTASNLDVYFMPEFLTEKNWPEDFKNCQDWVFGLKSDKFKDENDSFQEKITQLFETARDNNSINHNKLHFVDSKEAEMMKYFRNVFLACKVGVCNEMEQYCRESGINYDVVKNLGCLDPRITTSHTMVPGHDGKRGFGGTCFPKDINSLRHEMTKKNIEPIVLNAVIRRNAEVDRPNDEQEKGRAIV